MTFIGLLVHAGAAAQVLPLLAVLLFARRRVTAPKALILAWTLLNLGVDYAMLWIGATGNVWIYNISVPFLGATALLGLSGWQLRQVPRLTLRVSGPGFLVLSTVMLIAFGDLHEGDAMSALIYTLLGLGAALWTLVARGTGTTEPLLRQDWFWICGGLALYFGENTMVGPFANALRDNPTLVSWAYGLKSIADIVAFAAIAWGMTCPTHSSSSSSPDSSASRSSW